jgi:hypothetical protein
MLATEGENRIQLPVADFANGLYQVVIAGNNFKEMKKLIINRNN